MKSNPLIIARNAINILWLPVTMLKATFTIYVVIGLNVAVDGVLK